ncbi:ROK family transcriptional regulator [Dactylosporangium salmoneum]|uniref:ROK family transcriptional regulator n=1 Tax=Dactylosporangium salmoneum TaxID=53361 RepID=A0ABN3FY97_9ACTN
MSTPGGLRALVRLTHEERVLRTLREQGALSRSQIARAVGLSRSTLSEITGSLLQRGAIVVVDTDAAKREGSGRPAERLALDPSSGQFMGVDFGHRRVCVAVADASHEIIASGVERYIDDAPWPERLDTAFRLIDRLRKETDVHFGALQGIGIGVPGPHHAPPAAHPRLRELPPGGPRDDVHDVGPAFAARFDTSVLVDNNTRFAALAEAITGSSAVDDLIYVRMSDGVGGGLVVGGRLVTGSAGLAGEFGHVGVNAHGASCRCGKNGCLETVASVPAILANCRTRGVPIDNLDELRAAVQRCHPVVDQVLRAAAAAVGWVVGAAAMALNPAEIVIGGEIVRIAPVIVEQIRSAIAFELLPSVSAAPVVRAAELSDDDGSLGALAALFHSSPLLAGYPEPPKTRASDGAGESRAAQPTIEGVDHGRRH